jgi:hypothetical protein
VRKLSARPVPPRTVDPASRHHHVIPVRADHPGVTHEHLRISPAPLLFATREQRAHAAAWYAQRAPYRLRAEGGGRHDDGNTTLYCAASTLGGKAVACANKPSSLNGSAKRIAIGTALPVISNTAKPLICQRTKVTVTFDELPFWQPHIPGTAEHEWSVHRRSNVESAFSRVKDTAMQSVMRGDFRVMGITKVTIAILLSAIAANLAEVTRWRDRQTSVTTLDAARPVKTRKPRRLTLKRRQDAQRRAESRARRATAQPARKAGPRTHKARPESPRGGQWCGLRQPKGCQSWVELRGFEPLAFSLRTRRATNCATAPKRAKATSRLPAPGPGYSLTARPRRG